MQQEDCHKVQQMVLKDLLHLLSDESSQSKQMVCMCKLTSVCQIPHC